jgi:hypothetical protein
MLRGNERPIGVGNPGIRRPRISHQLRDLIRRMSKENVLKGEALRIDEGQGQHLLL